MHDVNRNIMMQRYALRRKDHIAVVGDLVTATSRGVGKVIGIERTDLGPMYNVQFADETTFLSHREFDVPIELTWADISNRVAEAVGQTDKQRYEFKQLMLNNILVPGGRILAAAGNPDPISYYNCFVIEIDTDSRKSILKAVFDMADIMARGGGVGFNASILRPKNAIIYGVNGSSSGSVSWSSIFSFVTGLISQGGSRRGALMVELGVWHPDIEQFITAKLDGTAMTNCNMSVIISDTFMAAVENDYDWDLMFPDTTDPEYDALWDGDIDLWRRNGHKVIVYKTMPAKELWNLICETAWKSGEPGLWFGERSNRNSNSFYYNKLVATNPCVVSSTRINTVDGMQRIGDLPEITSVAQNPKVNEAGFTPGMLKRNGVKPVKKITFDSGREVYATSEHKFMTTEGKYIAVSDIKKDTLIHIQSWKGTFGSVHYPELATIAGLLAGDGTFNDGAVCVDLWENKSDHFQAAVENAFNRVIEKTSTPGATRKRVQFGHSRNHSRTSDTPTPSYVRITSQIVARALADEGIFPETKLSVPEFVFEGNELTVRAWLAGYFATDGWYEKDGRVRCSSISKSFIQQIQQLLSNYGYPTYIREKTPNKELTGNEKPIYTLTIPNPWGVDFASYIPQSFEQREHPDRIVKIGPSNALVDAVESIESAGQWEVYDVSVEHSSHQIILNGLISHNCGEQPLPPWGVCNLASINLPEFITDGEFRYDSLAAAVKTSVEFLDNVVTLQNETKIEEDWYHKVVDNQLDERRIGLCTMGLAEAMAICGVAYGDNEECKLFIDNIYSIITDEAYATSMILAENFGPFGEWTPEMANSGYIKRNTHLEKYAKKGMRNVTLLSQAPNGTIATMMNTSTGIEPFFAPHWDRQSRVGNFKEFAPICTKYAGKKLPLHYRFAMPLTKEQRKFYGGMTKKEAKNLEISPRDHVMVLAWVSKWIDSAVSKTVNLEEAATVDDIKQAYWLMYVEGAPGGTVYRDGSRWTQVLTVDDSDEEIVEDGNVCPECKSTNYIDESGCTVCYDCGFSLCAL